MVSLEGAQPLKAKMSESELPYERREQKLDIFFKFLKEELHLCMQALCMQVTMVPY